MAVNFSAINTVYNHYLTTYAPRSNTSLDAHKKSELRNVYNTIIKLNKESPLYKFDNSDASKQYAINLKENAREFRNTIVSLNDLDESEVLNKKVAFSSNESIASARFIGESSSEEEIPTLDLQVHALASSQVNLGNFLPSDTGVKLPSDAYSFDISINDMNYEFQFHINESDTNKDIQNRLSRLITNSDIGLSVTTMEDESGNSSLRLEAKQTGLSSGKSTQFSISDDHTSQKSGVVNYLGIGEVTRYPSNAEITVNGIDKIAQSNNFTIEKTYELTLNGLSSDENDLTHIGLKNDMESLKENVKSLVGGYNNFIKSVSEYGQTQKSSNQLVSELNYISSYYAQNLSALGLDFTQDGTLEIDNSQLENAANEGNINETFRSVNDFAQSTLRKANQVSINPMNYVDKTIVAYKNPGKNFASPYITSAYSGMLFNSYC